MLQDERIKITRNTRCLKDAFISPFQTTQYFLILITQNQKTSQATQKIVSIVLLVFVVIFIVEKFHDPWTNIIWNTNII